MLGIEMALERSGDSFSEKYGLMKKRLLEVEYEHWAAGFASGNNHGKGHITRVLENLDRILGDNPLQNVTVYELFLTMMSILYHDVGLLQQRKGHADISKALLEGDENDAYIINSIDKEIIAAAVVSHSSSKDIGEECGRFSSEEIIGSYKARPSVIAALVRLADELDEDHRRADPILEGRLKLPEESKFFWLFCQRIRGVRPDLSTKRIDVNLALEPEDTKTYGKLPDGKIRHFVAFVAEKLEKINQERVVVNRFLPAGLQYTGLHIDVKPLRNHPTWKSPRTFVFNDRTSAKMFLGSFPELLEQPAKTAIREILVLMRQRKFQLALDQLDRLDSVRDDLSVELQMVISYEKACTYSLSATLNRKDSPEYAQAIDQSAESLIRWFKQGQNGGWEAIGRTLDAEVCRMASDVDLTNVIEARKKLLKETIPWPRRASSGGGGAGGGCVARGAKIKTPTDERPIETLRPGDALISLQLDKGAKCIATKITRVAASRSSVCIRLNRRWLLTPSQPIRTATEWVESRFLKLGDWILNAEGKLVQIQQIEEVNEYLEVYDLTTAHSSHNYLADGLLVHNKMLIDEIWRF